MKVFVTGVNGQLGHDVVNELAKRGHSAIGSDLKPTYAGVADGTAVTTAPYRSMDITDRASVEAILAEEKPDAIIHCAAWTAVDAAEDPENEAKVRAVNVTGTANIAQAAKALDAKMVYISTDYVFDGEGTTPWEADCEAYAPLSVYGKTKLEGELAVKAALTKYFIVRTAWVFGLNGNNFVKTMLKLAANHKELRIVDDQVGTPTYTPDLARLLVDMVETEKFGTYHATNEGGFISWADFAEEIFREVHAAVRVTRVSTAEYGLSKAKRPMNSRLSKAKLTQSGFTPLPHWKRALGDYLKGQPDLVALATQSAS